MASSSSSFSTLSAKAPPFVPPSTTKPSSTLSAKAPPFATPNSNRSSLIGASYYPSYDGPFDSELLGFDHFPSSSYDGGDVLELSCNFEDFQGVSIGPWNAPFDEKEVGQLEESDWISSSWRVPSLNLQGVQPKVTVPCKFSGASTSALSSHLSTSTSALESCNPLSNSYANRYGAQIYTYSTAPMAYCPVSTHSTSAQLYAPSTHGTSSIADSLSKTLNNTHFLPEESASDQKVMGEVFDGRRGANDNSNTNNFIAVNSSTVKLGPSNSSNESPLVKPIKLPGPLTSESKSIKQNNSMEDSSETSSQFDDVDSPCWKGNLAYRRSPFNVNEAVTPHLTSVQSVTEVQPYITATDSDVKTTFSVENSEKLIYDETKKVLSIHHSEKSLGVAFSSLQKRSEYPDILESEGNCKGIQCLDIGGEQRADLTKDIKRISEVLSLDQEITAISANQPRIADDITVPESGHKDALQNSSSDIRSCAVDATIHNVTVESHGTPVHSGQPSSAREYTQLIDETLQCLRKKLLSHAYKDENALKELLNDILLLVNDYPEASVLKNKKGIANGSYDDPEAEAYWSQIGGLKSQGYAVIDQSNNHIHDTMEKEGDTLLAQQNIKTSHDTSIQEKMQPIGHRAPHRQGVDFHNFAWEFTRSQIIGLKDAVSQSNISITHGMKEKSAHFIGPSMHDKFNSFADLTTLEGMANDFEKILKTTFCDQEENLLMLLHKNLWIEAQIELFSMKYELQLARTEIEMLKRNQSAKGRFQEANRNPSLNFWLDSRVSTSFFDTGESSRNFHQDMKDDAYLMNRALSIDQVCRQDATIVSAESRLGAHARSSSVEHGS